MRRFHGHRKIRFCDYCILPFEFVQLTGMPVMHNDRTVVARESQSRHQRARDTSTAQKDCGFHDSSEQAWSAASTSFRTSASVCAVEIIQCKPLEGVI